MSRQQSVLLATIAVILVVVLFYVFGFKPKQDELARIEAETEEAIAQEAALEARIAELQVVRARAPEIEAALATAESVIPRDQALPSALRQLQLAADDSGLELVTLSPGRPIAIEGDLPGFAELNISVQANGSYFQVVDFLRRIEDPSIVPRGIVWASLNASVDEYPSLSVALVGRMFALLPEPVIVPEVGAPPAPDVDVDVDVDADAEAEDDGEVAEEDAA